MCLRPPIGSDAAAREVQRLTDENKDLAARMLANNTRLNALAPISYLPPELLVLIFTLISPSRRSDLKHFRAHPYEASRTHQAWVDWIHVTHVCGHWRRVAVGDPSLWTVIYCELGPEWTELLLSRSKSSPIDIVLEQGTHTEALFDQTEPASIAVHGQHAKTISIDANVFGAGSSFEALADQFDDTMPILEKLELRLAAVTCIPDGCFCDVPVLKELVLQNVIPSWTDLLSFSNLVTFIFHVPDLILGSRLTVPGTLHRSRSEMLPTVAQLLDALETMRSLEHLSIHDALPEALPAMVGVQDQQNRVVSLPRLSVVSLSGPMLDCTSFAGHLDFPCTTFLNLIGNSNDDFHNDEIYPCICRTLEKHLARQQSLSRKINQINFDMSRPAVELSLTIASQYIFRLNVPFLQTAEGRAFLHTVFALLPVGDNARLSIALEREVATKFEPAEFEAIFDQPSLATISSVVIGGDTLHPLSPALTCNMPRNDPNFRPPEKLRAFNVLPGLQDVVLTNIDCVGMMQDNLELLRDEILNVIRSREDGGWPLRRLGIAYNPTIPLEWLQSLKATFPELVIWK
ncbi:hypothetical protein EVG20_g2148 [Dentipellis fragilis]|uniref:Uncharacterized protein n=1 Tax=Dentipellis fragilis TaxID=205917 RepID=A0A4Y9Z7K0_9AGAM|nr:hypothetical protein EVG20_g2148 [Dentipellis fragilis]